MRRFSIFLTSLVLAAMILTACGGEETSTSIPTQNVPPVTVDVTETGVASTATEVTTTEMPGIPVTGNANPASLSEQLTFPVLSQDGQQIGTVSDMVLDLENTNVAYVVVDTSGFGDLGERQILVPWESLKLQTGTSTGAGTVLATATTDAGTGGTDLATATTGTGTGGTVLATDTPSSGTGGTDLATATAGTGTDLATATAGIETGGNTGGQQNAFILQTDQDTFSNAPDFDISNLPAMGQSASDWDLDIRNYWENGGTGTGVATATSGTGTGTDLATATPGTGTGGTDLATATATAGTGTGGTDLATATTTTGTGLATATVGTGTGTTTGNVMLQGVVLATDILGSTVTLGTPETSTGTGGTGVATATAGTGTGTELATATPGTGTGGTDLATATATAGTGTGGTDLATATTTTGSSGTGTGSMAATIEDMIIATDTGDIQYILLNTNASTQQLIPVPLSMFQWDNTAQGFALNVDSTMLQNAPTLENGRIPDTTTSGWNSQFDTFWQNNGTGSSGTSSQATATPTP